MSKTVPPQTALIYLMVTTSAADADMTDRELMTMGDVVRMLPVFRDFDAESLVSIAKECAPLLNKEDGLDEVLDIVADSLPERLYETAYAICCDIVAADGSADQEELRILEMLRHRLGVDRLAAAAIERGARARHTTL
ncbi:MAG: tellurite resistance TerB family protein [Rhodospirillales bacterium]|nr:tellurite resistance TerB family protein [Rhodospirillales bacterium]